MKKIFTSKAMLQAMLLSAITMMTLGCNEAPKETVAAEDPVVVENDVWVVNEKSINDIPLVKSTAAATTPEKPTAEKGTAEAKKEESSSAGKATVKDEDAYEMAKMEEVHSALAAQDYAPMDTISVAEAIIPLDETQTAIAYGKKGTAKAAMQVVSDADGNVEQVVFADKQHHDVYNVQAGMSGKDVKKLRKDLKREVRKGKVFLYSDDSNIMYLMDATDTDGNEVTDAEVDTMSVQAVIWKDKKHHKKKG